ncbi:MAG: GHMP kinase [Actinomycetota bacterium]
MIRHAAPSRVGILGNPSDGYGGKTLALAVPRFEAAVTLEPAEQVEIVGLPDDRPCWSSLAALVDHVDRHGYGTGPQLLAAAVRTFVDVARSVETPLPGGFRLSYATDIPRQVGLGGSSALVIAALRCLQEHFDLDIPTPVLPTVALRAETAELGISAGLQDRVVQSYGGLVAMDFGETEVDSRFGVSHGAYEPLDPRMLPPLFLAFRESAAEPSDAYHQRLRSRYEAGDAQVRDVLRELAGLVVEGRAALRWGDGDRFAELIGRNMALRLSLGPVPDSHLQLAETAGLTGATATFTGSGGAVVGAYRDDEQLEELRDLYADIGADVIPLGDHEPTGDEPDPEPASEFDNVVTLQSRQSS